MLEKYSVTLYEEHMVKHLIDQIMSPNIELKTKVNICRSSHSYTFFKASTNLSTVLSRLYTSANPSSGRFRKRIIYADGRGDRGSGRGRFFNGRGRGIGREVRSGKCIGGHVQGGCVGGRSAH